MPNKMKKIRQTNNRFSISGIECNSELIATFRPWFLEINLKGLKTLIIRKTLNF